MRAVEMTAVGGPEQVGATFRLEEAADAHRALEAGQVIGKVVLVMD